MFDESYFDDEEFQELLDDYEKTVKAGEMVFMDTDDLADIADYYQLHGRTEEAGKAIERALELEPGATAPLSYKFHEAIYNDNVEEAEDYLNRMTDEQTPEYVLCQAELLIAKNQVEQADQYLREKFREVPPEEYQDYVLDAANLYADYNLSDKAMEWMMRAKQENTEDFKELMGRTLFGLGKYQDSERIFNELLDKNPFQKRYWNALASAQFMREDYNASITSSEYAIAIDPKDTDGLVAKANSLYRLENFSEALEYYRRYSEQMPDDEFGWLHQGTCQINLGCHEEAVELLKKAEATAPPDSQYLPDIYQELAFAHNELKQPETALYYLDQTANLDCNHEDILVIKGHIMLSNDRPEEAEKLFKRAIADSGNSPQIVLRVIVSLFDNQYIQASYQLFQKYFELVGDDCNDGYAYMALCCRETGRMGEYLKNLKTACERNPHEAHVVLGALFPEGMAPKDYYKYTQEQMKKIKKP